MERDQKEKSSTLISTLKKAIYKHGYLIITAAWLYTFSFIFINYWSYNASPQKVQSKLSQRIIRLEDKLARLLKDTQQIKALIGPQNNAQKEKMVKEDYGLFIYELNQRTDPDLLYWNTNQYYTVPDDLYRNDSSWFSVKRNGEFEIIKTKINLSDRQLLVLGMIPIRWSYFIENKYLHSDFADYKGLDQQYELMTVPGEEVLPIYNGEGKELFGIRLKQGKSFLSYDGVTILLRVFAIVFLLIFLHSICIEVMQRNGFRIGYALLVALVVFIRLIAYQFSFPFDYSKLPLYDPSIYASNMLHPSLGDLLVNAILLFWLIGLYKNHTDGKTWFIKPLPVQVRNYGGIFLLTFMCYLIAEVVKSLVQDSKISTDVTNFFSLDFYSVISFVILCFLVLSFFEFSQIVLRPITERKFSLFEQSITVAISGFLCLILFYSSKEIPSALS